MAGAPRCVAAGLSRGSGLRHQGDVPTGFRAWAALRDHPASLTAYHAAEAQLLWELRQGLRREASTSRIASRTGRPSRCSTAVARPSGRQGASVIRSTFCTNPRAARGCPRGSGRSRLVPTPGNRRHEDFHQHRLGPHDTPYDLAEVRDAMYASLPMIHLPEIVVDVDAKVRFQLDPAGQGADQ